jgi:hypothetical protein
VDDLYLFNATLVSSEISLIRAGLSVPEAACYNFSDYSSPFRLIRVHPDLSNVSRVALPSSSSSLDYESCSVHYLTVKTSDTSGRSVYCSFLINVLDANDPPVFAASTYYR